MIQVNVANFKGCSSARFAINPITLIAGANSAGKSSILYPVACAVHGMTKAFGLSKDAQKALVPYDGAKEAVVTVSTEDWGVTITWPSGKTSTKGGGSRVSAIAAGLAAFPLMALKDRAMELAPYMKAQPSKEDWEAACKEAGVSDLVIKEYWNEIEAAGGVWDAVWTTAKEEGAQQKGIWRSVTGDAYGIDKAEGWAAEGTPKDTDIATLEAAVLSAQEAVETKAAQGGASSAERSTLTAKAKLEPKLRETLKTAKGDADRWGETLTKAENKLKATPIASARPPSCPHCEKNLLITVKGHDYVLKKAGEWDEAEQKRLQQLNDAADAEFNTARSQAEKATRLMHAAEDDLKTALAAKEQLAAMGDGEVQDLTLVRADLDSARNELRAVLDTEKATEAHNRVLALVTLVKLLGPAGVRREAMVKGLEDFNAGLKALSDVCGWEDVAITADMGVTYFDMPWEMMADNEKFRTTVLLQTYMAALDKSQMVVIDGAEILDAGGRNGLFKLLAHAKIPALVAMTMAPDKAPDLSKAGIGNTVIMEDGSARLLSADKAA